MCESVSPLKQLTTRILAVPVISPITLHGLKTMVPEDVLLSWVGGAPGFDLAVSTERDFASSSLLTPLGGTTDTSWLHPGVMNDGELYYYRVD